VALQQRHGGQGPADADAEGTLEFFGQNAQGVEGRAQIPLGKLRFVNRLLERPDEEIETLGEEVVETLRGEVAAMNTDNFVVRPHTELDNLIIDYLTQNGVMDASNLYESPFTD
jgi:type I site-specific restriction endonuclease